MSDRPLAPPGDEGDPEGPVTGADEPVPGIDLSEPEASEPAASTPEAPESETPRPEAPAPDPVPTEPPPAPASAPPAGPTRQPPWMLIAGVVAAVLVVVLVIVLTRGGDDDPPAAGSTTTTSTAAQIDTGDWDTAEVANSQFRIRHPKDWERLEIKDDVKVLLRFGPQSVLGVTVRDIASTEAADVIQQAMSEVQLLEEPSTFVVDGFPAAVYIYAKEKTDDSPDDGVVVHYFVVANTKLYAMVFAVSPPEELNRVARTISAVANTFTSTAEKPPAPASTTTAPGSSTSTSTGG